jgi:hypothetical protein
MGFGTSPPIPRSSTILSEFPAMVMTGRRGLAAGPPSWPLAKRAAVPSQAGPRQPVDVQLEAAGAPGPDGHRPGGIVHDRDRDRRRDGDRAAATGLVTQVGRGAGRQEQKVIAGAGDLYRCLVRVPPDRLSPGGFAIGDPDWLRRRASGLSRPLAPLPCTTSSFTSDPLIKVPSPAASTLRPPKCGQSILFAVIRPNDSIVWLLHGKFSTMLIALSPSPSRMAASPKVGGPRNPCTFLLNPYGSAGTPRKFLSSLPLPFSS